MKKSIVIAIHLPSFLALIFLTLACSQPRIKRYENMIERKVGTAKKEELDKMLGNPYYCQRDSTLQKCEYRTSSGRNHPTPAIFRKSKSMGPDVSPYDYFDVLHLFYDDQSVLQEWRPIVIRP